MGRIRNIANTTHAAAAFAGVLFLAGTGASAQEKRDVPSIDTEDATLGSDAVASTGWLHPSATFDVRNGDFARGNYDDDAADLGRVPVHVQLGLAADLHPDAEGRADTWLVLSSSNGFHSPRADERTAPRAWYESNNLAALVTTPAPGVRAAAIYTVKTSPNGVAGTSHEASLAVALDGDRGLAAISPTFAVTARPKGGGGVYTQVGAEPSLTLGPGDNAATLGVPVALGVGWSGFYERGSGDRLFGQVGMALAKPFALGGARWSARAEVLALIRDDRLARLSGPDGETGTVVPLATISLSLAY